MENNLDWIPSHYWLGLIPCLMGVTNPNTCRSIDMEKAMVDLYGLDILNDYSVVLKRYWNKDVFIPVEDMDNFLSHIETVTT